MKALNCARERNSHSPASGAEPKEQGFTFTELVVVLAVIMFGLLMLLPAMGNTQTSTRALQCLNNLRQMQVGAQAYADDSNGVLLPNAPVGTSGPAWCNANMTENWGFANANTNPAAYLGCALAPYIGNHIELYKCPGDVVPSDNGQRLRSYSMNGMMGTSTDYNSGLYRIYQKVTDLVGGVTPAKALVFMEENICSLNDGYMQPNLNNADWPDVPGSYHNGAMGASFADGHTELHQWVTSSLLLPVRPHWTAYHVSAVGGASNPDYIWFKAHISERR
jgi:prepilin-type processing-associated H-X9-DG protein